MASTSAAASSSSTSLSSSLNHGARSEEVAAAMKVYTDGMAKLVEEADTLRLVTVKTLAMDILNTKQAVELLIAAKQLHLSVHDWGLERDRQHGCD